MTQALESRRRRIATAAGLLVGAAAYLLTLFNYSTSTTRTANSLGYASNFFDFQGRALLDGRLAVPRGSLGIEGFIRGDHEFMYFPPWPAVLRMPVLSTTTEYDGELTVLSMALGFVLLMVVVTKLVWLVREMLYPDEPLGRLEATAMGLLIALATGGTTLTYVAALPWVYHEVYAWAIPFAVGSMYWMLRVLREPTRGPIVWLLVFNLGTIMTRTTGGWAVCLVTIAMAAWVLRGRVHDRPRLGWAVLVSGVVPLAIGIAVNMLKFRHPFMFPLEDQVWTAVNQHRREALAANGGSITGLQFFPSSFMAYLRVDGIRFVDYFPWITLPARPAASYNGAFLDQTYRTGSVTAFMPWLLAMTVLATLNLFRASVDQSRRFLRAPLIAGVLITGGVMAYGYIAFRYTSEFVPALILGGTVGTCVFTRFLLRRRRWVAIVGVSLMAVLTAFSIAAHMLTGYAAIGVTGGGERLARMLELQHRLSPDAQERLITRSDDPPSGGSADDIWVRGDCDAIYVNSGDRYDPWMLVQRRSLVVEVTADDDTRPGRIQLAEVDTDKPGGVWLQLDDDGQARVYIVNETGSYYGPWFELLEPAKVRVGIRDEPGIGYAQVTSNPGGYVGYVRAFQWDEDWISRMVELNPTVPNPDLERLGIEAEVLPGLEPSLCHDLADGQDE